MTSLVERLRTPKWLDSLRSDAAEAADTIEELARLLGRICDAYKLVCDDSGMTYYQSQGSVYAHCIAALEKVNQS